MAFVKGLQGDDPRYLKTVATPKHYAVHSGPENVRHPFDAVVSLRDMRGYVVSDCGAIDDIYMRHRVTPPAAAAALAVKHGCER